METILFPTRGGPASYPNQNRAIALAKERDANLIFIYVSNIQFLDQFASPILVDVETIFDEMGEFMLTMAQERAAEAGVEAQIVVSHGDFQEALEKATSENEVDLIIFGSPSKGTGITTPKYMRVLAENLKNKTGVAIMFLQDGEFVSYKGEE